MGRSRWEPGRDLVKGTGYWTWSCEGAHGELRS